MRSLCNARYWTALLCAVTTMATAAQSVQPGTSPGSPVTWVLFVDDLHLDFRNTGRLRDLLKTIAAELFREGDTVAMAASGPSRIAIDATTDRRVVTDAIRMATGNALRFEDMKSAQTLAEVRYRAMTSLATAQSIVANAARLPGPKAMLYVSNGFNASPQDIQEQLAALVAAAGAADVRIYAVQPRFTLDASAPIVPDPAWDGHVAATQSMLRSLSESTVGFAILGGDLIPALQRLRTQLQ